MKKYTDLIDESVQLTESKTVGHEAFSSLTEQFMKKIENMAKMKKLVGGPKRLQSASFEKSYFSPGTNIKDKSQVRNPHFTISGWHGNKPAHWGPGFIIWEVWENLNFPKFSSIAKYDGAMQLDFDRGKQVPEKLLHDYIKFLSKAEKEIADVILKIAKK